MRNFKLALCVLSLGLVSGFTHAATQGTVEFNGKLINETCKIDDDSVDIVVQLPTLSTQTLTAAGDTGGSRLFDISVNSCPASITKVAAHFEAIGGSGSDASTGNLTNDAKASGDDVAATNVQIRLYNSDEKPLALGATGSAAAVDSTGKASMRYYGGYYATGKTTAGLVHAKARYTLSYP
ncbi:fimbrial protein [Erwinia phyllosphaerae]|uniref:fimbrial protein n=1 Tax=Erwinia phyllosphaerae TaxID=2853256 RepID=UPI001FEE8826|nr:fimbrial protein [Erwinia phyllosphaerae]MBV4367414.1 fimbrial protein [Erwinia phyllosphaerae]